MVKFLGNANLKRILRFLGRGAEYLEFNVFGSVEFSTMPCDGIYEYKGNFSVKSGHTRIQIWGFVESVSGGNPSDQGFSHRNTIRE